MYYKNIFGANFTTILFQPSQTFWSCDGEAGEEDKSPEAHRVQITSKISVFTCSLFLISTLLKFDRSLPFSDKKILGKKKTILGIFTCGHVLLRSPSLPRSSPLIQAWASSHTHSSQSTKSRRASNPLLSSPWRCSLHFIIKLGIVIFSTFLMCSQQLQVGTTLQQKNYY